HRPATSGPLIASGKIIKIGKNISVAETRVYGPTGNLLASGRGAYVC
ncbi:MAG TPA: thioesterase, partial [Erythrobacter sp.]|nr:thioesterase [Erythrobacter sp.]